MSTATLVEILLGLLTAAIAYSGYTSARQATRTQARAAIVAVDAGAYERAREIYEGAILQMRSDMETVKEESSSLRKSNTELRDSNEKLRESNRALSAEVTALRREMEKTRNQRDREEAQDAEIRDLRREISELRGKPPAG